MLAILREVEWSGMMTVDIEWNVPCCPCCGGIRADLWDERAQLQIVSEGFSFGHKDDCVLARELREDVIAEARAITKA